MKELSIEEKAKAYDEALKVLHKYDGANIMFSQSLKEEMFPELKESEDERIRKELLEHCKRRAEMYNTLQTAKEYRKVQSWIAWLEKQGEQPKKHDICDNCDQQGSCVSPCPMKLVEKQDEQKPTEEYNITGIKSKHAQGKLGEMIKNLKLDKIEPKFKVGDTITDPTDSTFTFHINVIKDGKYIESDKDWVLIKEADSDYELVEQKSTEWSKEDERKLEESISLIKSNNTGTFYYEKNELISFLKSLKYRVIPQPVWSKEDDETLCRCISATFDHGYLKECDWLKSFRPQNWTKENKERYISCLQRLSTGNPEQPETINSKWFKKHVYPHSQWKPTDEQISLLEELVEDNNQRHFYNILRTLYEQLKKLREE